MTDTLFAAVAERLTIDRDRWASPLDLACDLDPRTLRTPALELINTKVTETLNTRGGRLIVSMPPQEGKSSAVTKPAPLWLLARNPEMRVAIASYSVNLAQEFGGQIRDWIATFNGSQGTLDLGLRVNPSTSAKAQWALQGHRGGLIAVGIGAGSFTGKPCDALFIDDPFGDMEDADSPAFREKVWQFWQTTAVPRFDPAAPVILIQTRWHEDDLAGRLQRGDDGQRWQVLNIPALADHDPAKGERDPLGRQPGEWLISTRGRTVEDWEATRITVAPRGFTALYQGRPSPESGNVWQRSWWRTYSTMLWSQAEDSPEAYVVDMDEVVQSWDMAFKDTKGSDYVVGQVWGRKGANVYLLDQVHKRLAFTDTIAAVEAMCRRWPQATAKYVEDKANGTAVLDTLKDRIGGFIPVTPHESKYARAVAVSPYLQAGNVHLPTVEIALFDTDGFIEEAAQFPNGAHDDQVDATSQALYRMLLDGSGAAAWITWMREQVAEQVESNGNGNGHHPEPQTDAERMQAARQQAFRDARPR